MQEQRPNIGRAGSVRVLHVISGLFYGGGQRVVLDLLKSMRGIKEVASSCCTLGRCGDSPLAEYCDHSVDYDGRYNHPRVFWKAARQLKEVIRRENADILHTHGLDADLIGGLAVRGTGARQVCHLHVSPPADRRESWKAAVRRKLFRHLTGRRGSRFIAVSDAVREQMIDYYRLPAERVITVRNGIDTAEFDRGKDTSSLASDRVLFGTAARLAPMKGLDYLIQAAARLRDRGVDFEVRIAGTGNQKESLEKLVQSLDLSRQVRLVGHISDMPAFYRELDVFVLPSVSTEGLPLSVLEAMAMRLPVVASDVGGTAEAMRDGTDGILVRPGEVEELAAALEKLAVKPDLRKSMRESGHDRACGDFCLERVAGEVREVYDRVLHDN